MDCVFPGFVTLHAVGELLTMYGFRSGGSSGFSSIRLSPWSFFIIFTILFIWLFQWFRLLCLPDKSSHFFVHHWHLCCFGFFYNLATGFSVRRLSWPFLPQAFEFSFFFFCLFAPGIWILLFFFFFSFFLSLPFCHRHLCSVSFSTLLALVLISFGVAVYPSPSTRQGVVLRFSMIFCLYDQTESVWSFVLSHWPVAYGIGLSLAVIESPYATFDFVPKHEKCLSMPLL